MRFVADMVVPLVRQLAEAHCGGSDPICRIGFAIPAVDRTATATSNATDKLFSNAVVVSSCRAPRRAWPLGPGRLMIQPACQTEPDE